ncbi:hypothetical protein DLL80_23840 [Salmonella enterica subsp. enterica serovar Newport]|uniref:Uncharacterized protein n=1 Tax=Salmonella newport TaxID=108619 RepID=A0A5V6RMI5_SALNE|nr:hypothetical protein [Salmonella enterica subsp. enterica serovar Newport]
MYKPSVAALIQIIRKTQADNVELTAAINVLSATDNASLAVVRALANAKEVNKRFIIDMFNDLSSHDELITDDQLSEISELHNIHSFDDSQQ